MLYYKILLLLVLLPLTVQSKSKNKDGFFHIGLFGQYSAGSKYGFKSYVAGVDATNVILPGQAEFGAGSLTSIGVEFIFWSSDISGFSVGHSVDSSREIEHKQITYENGSSVRTYLYPRDHVSNSSFIFNYYLTHTPDRGYIVVGLNHSNPTWAQSAPSNSAITIKGDLGMQASVGFALLKGMVFDITARTTAIKLQSRDPIAGTFEDFGRGNITDVLVGFKFIY